tara:strand:- start:312249 stop:313358 length:1110 start_codon:yes stop_codon:yes gene_type:complete
VKYYIIAGEASGDLHGSNLIKAIKQKDSKAEFRVWGGDLMQAQGATLVKHFRDLAFMGFIEVIFNLRTILKNIKFCKEDIEAYHADVLVFIDYPGFNLRIAEYARQKGIKTVYYISPQIWAWKQSRVHKIKRDVDKMLCILPFEKDFYAKFDYDVEFVGHPLIDAIEGRDKPSPEQRKKELGLGDKKVILLMPGSRKQEISTMLPIMTKAAENFPDYDLVVAGAPSQELSFYKNIIGDRVKVISGKTYELLEISTAALVTSGTATLETALFKVPEVVCYKGNWLSYFIARQLVKIKYISLVNLIMDKEVITELIQAQMNVKTISQELEKCLKPQNRKKIIESFDELELKLGGPGASQNAAKITVEHAKG